MTKFNLDPLNSFSWRSHRSYKTIEWFYHCRNFDASQLFQLLVPPFIIIYCRIKTSVNPRVRKTKYGEAQLVELLFWMISGRGWDQCGYPSDLYMPCRRCHPESYFLALFYYKLFSANLSVAPMFGNFGNSSLRIRALLSIHSLGILAH